LSSTLLALSPLDGRYALSLDRLRPYCSEFALIRHRVQVEFAYLLALLEQLDDADAAAIARAVFGARILEFGEDDARAIKTIEARTNHDVKAVEYWLKALLETESRLTASVEWVHFALTSEDVNNLSHALMLQGAIAHVLIPCLTELLQRLIALATPLAATPMLARTHGQPATPTTMGKELAVFIARLAPLLRDLTTLRQPGKLNGATGNFNAHAIAYPSIDWPAFSDAFVRSLGLVPNRFTTQIEPHDGLAATCDRIRHINLVLLDLNQDLWRYISDGYFKQRVVDTEVGSSAMPHKVNPIDFENSEGNLGLANAVLNHLTEKLTRSRLQRDLSDSTVLRNLGVGLGHTLLAWQSCIKGLGRIDCDAARLKADLDAHPEILAEAYQTVLRSLGHDAPYERLKQFTRGEHITLADMHAFLKECGLDADTTQRLRALTPAAYIGRSPELALQAIAETQALLEQQTT
jgi:adenylosuccinate lyase